MIRQDHIVINIESNNTVSEKYRRYSEKYCCLPFWRKKYSAHRYYLMVFSWFLLIFGVCATFGYYMEQNTEYALAPYWIPIFITVDVVSPLYLIWYFYIEYNISGSNCCICC